LGALISCGDTETPGSTGSSGTSGSSGKEDSTPDLSYQYDMKEYITLPSYKNHEITIELDGIQQMIDEGVMQNAQKSKRTICMQGDVVNVTYIGYRIDENGEILYKDGRPVVFNESDSYGVYLGAHLSLEEFEKGIVGMEIDEIKEIYVTLPQDYHQSDLAGQKVIFEIILNAIYEPPVYSNNYVSTYFPDYTNTVDYENSLKNEIILNELLTYISDNSTVISYPQKEYEQLQKQLKDMEADFESQYKITLDEYLDRNYGQTREEYIKSQIKKNLVYYALAQAEKIEITDEMLTNEKSSLISYYKEYYMEMGVSEGEALTSAKSLVEHLGEAYIYENVLYAQVEGAITHFAKVTEKAATYKSITDIFAERLGMKDGDEIGDLCPSFELEVFDGNGSRDTALDPSKNVGKFTIINFWGTWCTPCKKELVDFNKIATDYKEQLTIYAVHSYQDYRDASEYVLENYSETEMIFLKDFLIDPKNEYGGEAYFKALGGSSLYPYTVILDKNGIIQYKHEGGLTYDELLDVLVGLGLEKAE
ncbi:MAG: redoxin domain-containing protein, partial [Ruminococcaceae bacterium]|nr:redoxin domain-containing protein [Oscillospiraceae bacterium]